MKCRICNHTDIDKIVYDPRDGSEIPCGVCQDEIDDAVSDFYKNEPLVGETLEEWMKQSH